MCTCSHNNLFTKNLKQFFATHWPYFIWLRSQFFLNWTGLRLLYIRSKRPQLIRDQSFTKYPLDRLEDSSLFWVLRSENNFEIMQKYVRNRTNYKIQFHSFMHTLNTLNFRISIQTNFHCEPRFVQICTVNFLRGALFTSTVWLVHFYTVKQIA